MSLADPPKKITELWAWICTEEDGGEGVPATSMTIGGAPYFVPLMGADEERIRSLQPTAEQIAHLTGRPTKLMRFTGAEIIEELKL